MKITIFSFEKKSRSPFEDVISEYRKRVSARFSVEERYIKDEMAEDQGRKIITAFSSFRNPFVILLDEQGRETDSRSFADMLLRLEQNGKNIVFVIGPHSGFQKPVKFRYDMMLSLS